jgi:NAD(P)-dependent dehydrogenase (short-subunit alcohol dehydrogenase family)
MPRALAISLEATVRLHNQVAIVTGGGRAIGRTIAIHLAREGASIAVAGPHAAELDAVAAEIESLDRPSLAIETDLRHEDQVHKMVAQTQARFGPVAILVNNAAVIGPTTNVEKIAREDWDDVLAVNLTGAFLACRAVLPEMIARRAGKIINISSIAGKLAYPLRAPYAVSKWGLIGLTVTLASEVGPHHIQVNAVCPGPVDGDRMRQVIQSRASELGREYQEIEQDFVNKTALHRMVRADDVADLVVFLASQAADNITGQAIDVSAGYGI